MRTWRTCAARPMPTASGATTVRTCSTAGRATTSFAPAGATTPSSLGAGADFVQGGRGRDTLVIDGAGASVDLSTLTGTGTGGDTYRSIENVTGGAGADTITGTGGANRIEGGRRATTPCAASAATT